MIVLIFSPSLCLSSAWAMAKRPPMGEGSPAAQAKPTFASVPSPETEGRVLLTLEDVIEEAKNKNPEIAAAKRKWEEEKAKIWVVKTWADPEIGVEYWGKHETWYDVSQTVPFPGKLALKGKAQAHEAKRQLEYYHAKEKEILQKVKAAYYSYFLVWRQIEIFEESVNLLERFAKVAENKYSANRATQADVLKAQLEYSKSLNALVTLGQEKETTQAELNALLDRKPGDSLGKPDEPSLPPFELTYEDLETMALENRPELHAARHHVDHMNAELWSTRADFLPDTTVQYSRRVLDDASDDNILMVKFNVPLVWFWRQGSLVKAAKKAKEEAEEELRSTETMTRYDVKSMLVKTQSVRRLVVLYQTSVIPQAETSLKVASAGYEAGTVGFLDLVDSHRSWLEFQMEYYEYLAQYWSYLAALERVVGKDLIPFEAKEGVKA
jgi:outer membrane protein TolC